MYSEEVDVKRATGLQTAMARSGRWSIDAAMTVITPMDVQAIDMAARYQWRDDSPYNSTPGDMLLTLVECWDDAAREQATSLLAAAYRAGVLYVDGFRDGVPVLGGFRDGIPVVDGLPVTYAAVDAWISACTDTDLLAEIAVDTSTDQMRLKRLAAARGSFTDLTGDLAIRSLLAQVTAGQDAHGGTPLHRLSLLAWEAPLRPSTLADFVDVLRAGRSRLRRLPGGATTADWVFYLPGIAVQPYSAEVQRRLLSGPAMLDRATTMIRSPYLDEQVAAEVVEALCGMKIAKGTNSLRKVEQVVDNAYSNEQRLNMAVTLPALKREKRKTIRDSAASGCATSLNWFIGNLTMGGDLSLDAYRMAGDRMQVLDALAPRTESAANSLRRFYRVLGAQIPASRLQTLAESEDEKVQWLASAVLVHAALA